MENYDIGLTLTKLSGASLKTNADGRKAVVIFLDECPELNEKNGAVYLDLSALVAKNQMYSTHCILGKRKTDGTSSPILGFMRPWKKAGEKASDMKGYLSGAQSLASDNAADSSWKNQAPEPEVKKDAAFQFDDEDLPF